MLYITVSQTILEALEVCMLKGVGPKGTLMLLNGTRSPGRQVHSLQCSYSTALRCLWLVSLSFFNLCATPFVVLSNLVSCFLARWPLLEQK